MLEGINVSDKNWESLDLTEWGPNLFLSYLSDIHEELYNVPYHKHKNDTHLIKYVIDNYGKEITKKFIDVCLSEFEPSAEVTGISFTYMFENMRGRVMPVVIANHLFGMPNIKSLTDK